MTTNIKAVVKQNNQLLTQQSTLTLKNTLKDQITIRELANVVEGSPQNGDVLTYNSVLNKYEVKPVTTISISGLDGGTF